MVGYIYILYNDMYNCYGNSVYKVGKTNNLDNRMNSYTTSYIYPSKYIYTLEVTDETKVEKVTHMLLNDERIVNNREFFNAEIDIIIDSIKEADGICSTDKKFQTFLTKYKNNKKQNDNTLKPQSSQNHTEKKDTPKQRHDEKRIQYIKYLLDILKLDIFSIDTINKDIERFDEIVIVDKDKMKLIINVFDVRSNEKTKKSYYDGNYKKLYYFTINCIKGMFGKDIFINIRKRQKGGDRFYNYVFNQLTILSMR